MNRSSRPEMPVQNFAEFTGKQLCQSLVFNKVAKAEGCNFIERSRLSTGVFL